MGFNSRRKIKSHTSRRRMQAAREGSVLPLAAKLFLNFGIAKLLYWAYAPAVPSAQVVRN